MLIPVAIGFQFSSSLLLSPIPYGLPFRISRLLKVFDRPHFSFTSVTSRQPRAAASSALKFFATISKSLRIYGLLVLFYEILWTFVESGQMERLIFAGIGEIHS